MKISLLMLVAFPSVAFATGDAPYCIFHDSSPTQCFYYSIQACEDASKTLGGRCFPNSAQRQVQPIAPTSTISVQPTTPQRTGPSIYEMSRQNTLDMQEARSRALADQETRARIELLNARAAQVKSRPETNNGYWVLYLCPDGNGNMTYTGTPAKGCVVEQVTAY